MTLPEHRTQPLSCLRNASSMWVFKVQFHCILAILRYTSSLLLFTPPKAPQIIEDILLFTLFSLRINLHNMIIIATTWL